MADLEKVRIESAPTSPTEVGTDNASERSYDLEATQEIVRPGPWYRRLWSGNSQSKVEVEPEAESNRVITRILDQTPKGYPSLATFQCSDMNFMQFRSFAYLHSRLLLALQHDISMLEHELDQLDEWDVKNGDPLKLGCKRRDDFETTAEEVRCDFPFKRTRTQVLHDLKRKLMEYDDVLLKTREVVTLQRPAKKDWQSLRWWMFDRKPIVDKEADFILRKEDIITLRSGRECAGFDGAVEHWLSRLDHFLLDRCGCTIIKRIFVTPELEAKTSSKRLNLYSPERLNTLVNVLITSIIFVLLVLPVVAMYKLSNATQSASPFEAIGILIVFTLLFGMAMSSLTKATRQELFAASAAYAAVLVVFIGNFSTQTVEVLAKT